MIKVMMAGPYHAVRHGLKEILEQESDIRVTDEACSVKEVFERFCPGGCDVLILDFDMLRRRSIEKLKKLAEQCTTVPIIVMSIHSEEQFADRILGAGAKGFLAKDSISETVVQAVRKACERERLVGATLAQKLPR
jgi:two-component system invasion response regulator UvrY